MNRQERRAAQRQAKSNPATGVKLAQQAFADAEQMRQAGRNAEAEALCRLAYYKQAVHGGGLQRRFRYSTKAVTLAGTSGARGYTAWMPASLEPA